MTSADTYRRLLGRIDGGDPVRILIGHVLHRSTEIIPSPDFGDRITTLIRADCQREIARAQQLEAASLDGLDATEDDN